ncbi:MAG: ABC transporter ATP-binding protein [Sporichthyaceae bacterium]
MSIGAEIVVSGVGRTFGSHEVLRDIDLTVRQGEVVALLGASGSGKSTLLRLAGGLDRPSAGEVRIDGTLVRDIDPRTAYVFQEARLMPWRSLADNVALGLPRGMDKASGRRRVVELLEQVGLGEFVGHRPRGVSGGMAQRTALARALARNPAVLLLDEPFGALDALTRLRMQDLLLDLLREFSPTVLLVTHDVEEALLLADRIALLAVDPLAPERGAHIAHELTVPSARPRDRADAVLADLRLDLLDRLGVPRRPPLEMEEILDEAHTPAARPLRDRRAPALGLRGRGQG